MMIKLLTRDFENYEITDEAHKKIELNAPVVIHDALVENLANFFTYSRTLNNLNVNDVVFTLMISKRHDENKV